MKRTLLLFCVLFGVVASASAAVIIDFGTGTAGAGGTVTSTSGGNAVGVAIPVGVMTFTNGPTVTSYDTSGTATSSAQDANLSASLDFNTATNTITITGGIPTLSIANGTTLLSGSFSSFSVTNNFGVLLSVNGQGPDTKSPLLLQALGLPTNTPFQFFGFTIASLANGTVFNAFSTDIANTAVPEPTSILLLGTVLVGVCRVLRRRTAENNN
jgi:hypothetical protein